jgi:hypothetical protein
MLTNDAPLPPPIRINDGRMSRYPLVGEIRRSRTSPMQAISKPMGKTRSAPTRVRTLELMVALVMLVTVTAR